MMTDKKCLGIDCAWCASTECPNEKKEGNMVDNKISLEDLEQKDLCFEGIDDEKIYDYLTLDEFATDTIADIDQPDIVEFQNEFAEQVEKAKNLRVFTKEKFKISAERIKYYIQDFADDNWGTPIFYYEVQYSERVERLLNDFIEELNNENQVYTTDDFIGYIDLSEYLKDYED